MFEVSRRHRVDKAETVLEKIPASHHKDQYLVANSVCLHGWQQNQSPNQRHSGGCYYKSKGLRGENI